MGIGTEIDKSIVQTGLGEAGFVLSVIIGIVLKITIFIIIVTIAAAEDIVHTSLDIFHIGRGIGDFCIGSILRIVYHSFYIGFYATDETLTTLDLSAEIITAIDVVANPGEAQYILPIGIHATTANVSLCMS